MQPLPIDEKLPDVVEALKRERNLVIQAPPGTGKSTRIPIALHKALFTDACVAVAEPRRIAARLLAERVAAELGERVGETIGYRVRFEHVSSRKTRVYYATSGVLLRQLATDPRLLGIGCLVIDEFHERHIDTDLLLGLALHAQRTLRTDLKIVVMSATLDAERVRSMLDDCALVSAEAILHPVDIEYAPSDDDRPLEKQVASALRELHGRGLAGDTLVFLPGAREIRKVTEHLGVAAGLADAQVLALHGEMPLNKQAEVMQPAARAKVILTTNVAESSITVPGVTNVVDSGLARRAVCSPWTGLTSLEVHKVSRAAAAQRAGRAGRTAKGRAIRLFSLKDHNGRPEYETPELLRLDLCEALLLLRSIAAPGLDELRCLDRPTPQQIAAAEQLLQRLGAMTTQGEITGIGKQMIRLPLHPRLARLIVEAQHLGIPEDGCLAAALLSEKDLRLESRFDSRERRPVATTSGDSDVVELMDAFHLAADCNFNRSTCARERLDGSAARRVDEIWRQLLRFLPRELHDEREPHESLGKALLRGFPDRVAWRRQPGQAELVMCNGSSARISDTSSVSSARYLLAIDADERAFTGRKSMALVRVACRIDPNWLMDLDDPALVVDERCYWADGVGRVETESILRYGSIVLEESRAVARPGPEAAAVLVEVATQKGVLQGDEVTRLCAKARLLIDKGLLAADAFPNQDIARQLLTSMCGERVDLEGVDDPGLAREIVASLGPQAARLLATATPDSCQLKSGRFVKVNYEPNCAPWIASRLQDFFGMVSTPRIADGRQPLTLHLLAPNQRAVQVTQDLAGFWERHYPAIRRELMRRYPKHKWPEDPHSLPAVTVAHKK
jgi:ATP-dependent helicase HrpB